MVDVARGDGELSDGRVEALLVVSPHRLKTVASDLNQTSRCCVQELLITDKVYKAQLHVQCLSAFLGPVQESKGKCFCSDDEKPYFLAEGKCRACRKSEMSAQVGF